MQYQAASGQAAAQNAAYAQNRVAALAAQRHTEDQITQRQLQEAGATSQQLHNSEVDQARRQASATVSGVNAGSTGITLDALINDIGRASEDNRVTMVTNWENTAAQLQASKDASGDTEIARVNSVAQATPPSPLTPLLGIAGAGLKLFASETRADTPRV